MNKVFVLVVVLLSASFMATGLSGSLMAQKQKKVLQESLSNKAVAGLADLNRLMKSGKLPMVTFTRGLSEREKLQAIKVLLNSLENKEFQSKLRKDKFLYESYKRFKDLTPPDQINIVDQLPQGGEVQGATLVVATLALTIGLVNLGYATYNQKCNEYFEEGIAVKPASSEYLNYLNKIDEKRYIELRNYLKTQRIRLPR